MSRWTSDTKSRASRKAKALHEQLRKELGRKKVLKPEQEYIPKKQPWYVGS